MWCAPPPSTAVPITSLRRHDKAHGHRLHLRRPRTAPRPSWRPPSGLETRAVFGETIANPALTVLDFEEVRQGGPRPRRALIVDNTFATPVNCRPFEWGPTLSPTPPPSNGRPCQRGGRRHRGLQPVRLDGPRRQVPGLTTPDESYHGVTYTERFGLRGLHHPGHRPAHAGLRRHPAPMNAYLLNVGLETCPCAWARHCENALAVARFLKDSPKVSCALPRPGATPTTSGREAPAERHLRRGVLRREGRPGSGLPAYGRPGVGLHCHPWADAKTWCFTTASTTHRR